MARQIKTRAPFPRRNHRTVKLQSGDISVSGGSVNDCLNLAGAANELRKDAPPKIKLGPVSISAGKSKKLIETILIGIGGWGLYKGMEYAFKSIKKESQKNDENVEKPKFLKSKEKEPESLTLNEINRSCESDDFPLLGDLFYSGDIVVLFSITNSGKTIMGVQIAIDLANGAPSQLIPNCPQPSKQNVIYYNFEMRKNHLRKRYFNPDDVYPANLNIEFCKSSITTIDKLLEDIAIKAEGITCDTTIFIDTIKDVCPVLYAKEADRVIDSLRTIKDNANETKGVNITFVLLAQANKKKPWGTIELDDLSGSFNLAGLADSVFAIGNTRFGKSVRMLKMLKGRNDGIRDKAIILKIEDSPYLHMEYKNEMEEADALPYPAATRRNGCHFSKKETQYAEEAQLGISHISEEKLKEIRAFYQKGVPGHGTKQVIKKFGKETGLKYQMQVTRLIEKLEAMEKNGVSSI